MLRQLDDSGARPAPSISIGSKWLDTGGSKPSHVWNPAGFLEEAAPFGLRLANPEDLAPAHRLAESIMGMTLAPLQALVSAHAHTKAAAWIHDPEGGEGDTETPALPTRKMTGIFLTLPLNPEGEAALCRDQFNSRGPDLRHLCAPGEHFSAMYLWLFAGADGRSRRSVLRTALAWRDGAHAGVRAYARAATAKGARALTGFRFRPISPDRPSMFFADKRR